MTDKFDAIVVGAGPAGIAAAYCMAKADLSVLVLERGEYPGSKNSSGAVFHGEVLEKLLPGFWEEAPLERWITSHVVSILGEDSSISLEFSQEKYQKPVAISVLRAKFDRWFAQKALDAGALILSSTLVEDRIVKDGQTVGVTVVKDMGEVYADVVIAADGANSLLAEKAGLRKEFKVGDISLGVKEIIKIPATEIEKRFRLSGNEGVAYNFIGDCTLGIPGGSFLYTNRDSLSVGIIVHISSLKDAHIEPYTLLDHFKAHRAVAPLITDGTPKEYSAHLIPEGGYGMMPQLYTDGMLVVGDAAGFTLNHGLVLRGMDLAIASGIAAAETVIRAHRSHNFSKHSLSCYKQLLEQSFVTRDLRQFQNSSRLLQAERIYKEYPLWLNRAGKRLFTVDTNPRQKAYKILLKERPRSIKLLTILSDLIKGIRSL